MNERSSRAHSLVMLTLTQCQGAVEKRSRLFLADLGGSEKLSRSKAAEGFRSKVSATRFGTVTAAKIVRVLEHKMGLPALHVRRSAEFRRNSRLASSRLFISIIVLVRASRIYLLFLSSVGRGCGRRGALPYFLG